MGGLPRQSLAPVLNREYDVAALLRERQQDTSLLSAVLHRVHQQVRTQQHGIAPVKRDESILQGHRPSPRSLSVEPESRFDDCLRSSLAERACAQSASIGAYFLRLFQPSQCQQLLDRLFQPIAVSET